MLKYGPGIIRERRAALAEAREEYEIESRNLHQMAMTRFTLQFGAQGDDRYALLYRELQDKMERRAANVALKAAQHSYALEQFVAFSEHYIKCLDAAGRPQVDQGKFAWELKNLSLLMKHSYKKPTSETA